MSDSTSIAPRAENGGVAELVFDNLAWVFWPTVIVLGGVLLTRWRGVVSERLGSLAARRGGRFVGGPWFIQPRVEWTGGGTRLTVSVRGESSKHALSGSRTFAHSAGARYPACEFELRRAEGWRGEGESPGTRDDVFERAFRCSAGGGRLALELLDRDLRRMLLAFDVEHDVAVLLGVRSAYRDGLWHHQEREQRLDVSVRGLPERIDVLEDLLQLARALHERLERVGSRRAA